MDEYLDFPQVPHDPGDPPHGHADHDRAPPNRVHEFTDNMVAALDPSWTTPAAIVLNGLLVRTWCVHHETWLRSTDFRLVRLPPDRAQWIDHLTAAWDDALDVLLPTAFTLPSPMPTWTDRPAHCVGHHLSSQGLHYLVFQFSGLVTAQYIDDLDGLGNSVTAASFPDFVSAYHVMDAAQIHLCHGPGGRLCHVLHGWQTLQPGVIAAHRMRCGHSFTIQIPHDPNLDSAPAQAHTTAQSSVAAHGSPSGEPEGFFDTG